HPVPTLLSWRSLDIPVSRGRLPSGERFWRKLSELVSGGHDLLQVQAGIYNLFCERYAKLEKKITILKYEDVVKEGLIKTQIEQSWVSLGSSPRRIRENDEIVV